MSPTNNISWLHLSDLHAGKPSSDWDFKIIVGRLIEDLKKVKEEQNFHPDFIFFTGDVAFGQSTQKGALEFNKQYGIAKRFFNSICDIFAPEFVDSNLFIVPGNHDVNRSRVTEDQTNWLDQQRDTHIISGLLDNTPLMWTRFMERLQDYRTFIEELGYMHLLGDSQRLFFVTNRKVNGLNVGITGMNSAWSCGRDREKGRLWLGGLWQVSKAIPILKGADLKIALIHHPAGWFVEQEDPEISRLLQLEYNFSLHGHEHHDWVEKVNNHVRIASAACYDRHDKENGYNFVNLDLNSDKGVVWLRKYESAGLGWIPRLIPHITNDQGAVFFDIPGFKNKARRNVSTSSKQRKPRKMPKLIIKGSSISDNFLEGILNLPFEYDVKFTIKIEGGDNPCIELIPSNISSSQFPRVLNDIVELCRINDQEIEQVIDKEFEVKTSFDLDNDLVLLKLGGSLITDKTRPNLARLSKLDEIADQIAEACNDNPALQILLGHGAGSFGHIPAYKYGIRQGVSKPESWHGFAETWYQVSALNRLVVDALRRAGIPAITLAPIASITARDGEVTAWDLTSIKSALSNGLMPVVHGDVIFDEARGGTILSTESMFNYLALQLHPSRILLAGSQPGVWADYPVNKLLISELTTSNKHILEIPGNNEVIGGMVGKLRESLNLCSKIPGLSILIFSGEHPGLIKNALFNDSTLPGTLIKA